MSSSNNNSENTHQTESDASKTSRRINSSQVRVQPKTKKVTFKDDVEETEEDSENSTQKKWKKRKK